MPAQETRLIEMIGANKNEYCRILIAYSILVIAMSVLTCVAVDVAYAQQQQVEWPLYQNLTYGVSMLYPSNWTQQNSTVNAGEDQNSTVDAQRDRFTSVSEFFSPEDPNGYFAYVAIAIDNMPSTSNILSYRDQSIDTYRQDPAFQDFRLLSATVGNFTFTNMRSSNDTTMVLPAYSFESTYIDPELGPQNLLEVGTIFDNKGYYIQYFADPPIYQKHMPIVHKMIESFQIIQ